MRWNHIKTVMIVILIGVNLWLLYLILGQYFTREYLDADVVEDTVRILARSDIHIAVDQISTKKEDADIYEAVRGEDYFLSAAECFTDSPINEMLPTPNGMRLTADNGDSILIGENFEVAFLAAGQSRADMEKLSARILAEGSAVSADAFSFRRAKREIIRLLEKEISVPGAAAVAHTRPAVREVLAYDGYYLVRCQQVLGERELSADGIVCLCDTNGKILWLDGVWSFLMLTHNYSAQFYDRINILFIEKTAIDEMRVSGEIDAGMYVDSLTLNYVMNTASDKSGTEVRVFFSPAWRIRYTDGTERVYSAVTGEPVHLSE